MKSRAPVFLLAGAFLLHVLPFAVRPALIGGDEPHYALIAHSIATDGDVDLADDYDAVAGGSKAAGRKHAGKALDRHVRIVNGREIPNHPLGLPALAAPLVAVQQAVAPGSAPDILLGLLTLAVTFAAVVAGSRLVWRFTGSLRRTALVVFATYFATPLWFYSRTFFTEPWTWAWGALAVAAIAVPSGMHARSPLDGSAQPHDPAGTGAGGTPALTRLVLTALLLALALAMKESALLVVAPILVATWILRGFRAAAVLAVGPAVFAVVFVVKNLVVSGTAWTTFQPFVWGDPLAGSYGLLVDPARGLIWFAPVIVAAALGWFREGADRRAAVLLATSGAIFAGYFAVSAAWGDWGGGSGWGPRLLVPALPALAIPLARIPWLRERAPVRIGFLLLALAGFIVNWCAATDPFTAFWGAGAADLVEKNPWNAVSGLVVGATALWLIVTRVPPVGRD